MTPRFLRAPLTRWRGLESSSRVAVRNGTDRPLLVVFEPWCGTYELLPDAEYTFEATSPLAGRLTVEHGAEAVTVYAWDACVGRVFDGAGYLVDSLDIRTPNLAALALPARPSTSAATPACAALAALAVGAFLLMDANTFALMVADPATGRSRACFTGLEMMLGISEPGAIRGAELLASIGLLLNIPALAVHGLVRVVRRKRSSRDTPR